MSECRSTLADGSVLTVTAVRRPRGGNAGIERAARVAARHFVHRYGLDP